MAFTYDVTVSTDLAKVRLTIGDTVFGSGVKPTGENFTDAEITALLTAEGSWGRAAALACEVLAIHWARAVDVSVGPRRERLSQAAAAYREQAKQLRRKHGGSGRVYVSGVIRADGYSDDQASNDVTPSAKGEYPPDQYWLVNTR